MGEVILGIGTSHSPMLSTPLEEFDRHVERDKVNPHIDDFEALSRKNAKRMEPELRPEVIGERYEATQRAIEELKKTIEAAEIDTMVIVGDDQGEWFDQDNMPALSIYWNDVVESQPPSFADYPPSMKSAYWGYYGDGTNRTYPIDNTLGEVLIAHLTENGFDVHHCRAQPQGKPFGHAWSFIYQRLMEEKLIPIVPVMVNTYFPPNQPTVARCWDLGRAIKDAVERTGLRRRVAVVGSGGLSHFVVDEKLDRSVLSALSGGLVHELEKLPVDSLNSGSSEIRNWVAAGAASVDLDMTLVDYVPFYRSSAGTGVGLAFAYWQ